MKLTEAKEITGGLSNPSKMPGSGYSLPASCCKTGTLLAAVAGTICNKCYARKGRYGFPAVQTALHKRLNSITSDKWVEAIVTLIKLSKDKYFRWHDSGDIQSIDHLNKIAEVAKQLPSIKFWLPTKEYQIINTYLKHNDIPSNLTIRLSTHLIDTKPPNSDLPTSTVHTNKENIIGFECKSYTRENKCGTCRACWNKKEKNVSYPKH